MGGVDRHWTAFNQSSLARELERVRRRLEAHASGSTADAKDLPERSDADGDAAETSALDRLVDLFNLSPFERDVLVLCAGVELDAEFARACRSASPDASPSFSLALAAFAGAHWSALAPTAPLRYWNLVEIGPGESLVAGRLRIDERVLHYLAGVACLDARLKGIVRRHRSGAPLAPRQEAIAGQIAALWKSAALRGEPWPVVHLVGEQDAGAEEVARAALAIHGLELRVIRTEDLPTGVAERRELFHLWDREAALMDSGLLVLTDESDPADLTRSLVGQARKGHCPILLAGREPLRHGNGDVARFAVNKPSRTEQAALWRDALRPIAQRIYAPDAHAHASLPPPNNGIATPSLDHVIDRVTNQFSLGPTAIASVCAMVEAQSPEGAEALDRELWNLCRSQARSRLDDLAQRIDTRSTWEDLVLPPGQTEILKDILVHVRYAALVQERWGFGGTHGRGLGISVLFAGPSGTGKTLAAEILANTLRLDLYRVDLSQIVSKYIGETEKNLRRVFDAAETSGAVLLFDEADALFGKRSDVKDSHDRYANIEVSYLLQLMESYRGLAVLTTNMKQALDPAFKRRIRFVVQFPFPEMVERVAIWRRIFPEETPVDRLDVDALAKLNVAGGNIRNIALGAAFLAAEEGTPVGMRHLLRMARAECAKLERPLTDAEVGGWQ